MEFDDEAPAEEILSGGEEDTSDERRHNQLLDALSSLDGKKRNKLSQRTVISNQVSEFNFSSSKDKASVVRLNELIGSLKESTSHGELKNQLRNIARSKKTVSAPLPKHEKEKIERATAYETTAGEISKWDPIVWKNRKADQIQFPLEKPDFKIVTTDQLVKRFQPRTPLERQVAELLRGSENVAQNKEQELTPAEQKALQVMDVKEAKQRRIELMKYRALLSYKEAKAKRQKKIKSKRYHRVLKKEKLKNEKKQLEKLQEEDPEGYLEKLNQLEKDRAQERVSLKHRGGSKFAKRQMIYAKFDDKARQEVQDMLQKSRALTKKVEVGSDSEEEQLFPDSGVSTENTLIDDSNVSNNPWMARPNSGNSSSSFSRPQAVNGDDSDGENVQSEYSRPKEITNEQPEDDNDDDLANGDDDDYDEKDDVDDGNDDYKDDVEDGDDDNDDGLVEDKEEKEGSNEKNKSDDENGVDSDEEVTVMKSKPGVEVHDLSSINTDTIVIDKTIDEIFDKKQKKARRSRGQRRRGSKNKNLAKKKGESEKVIVTKLKNKNSDDKVIASKHDLDNKSNNAPSEHDRNMNNDEDNEESLAEGEQINNESLSRKRTLEEFEEMLANDSGENIPSNKKQKKTRQRKPKNKDGDDQGEKTPTNEAFVDPKKLFTIENKIKQMGSVPNVIDTENDNDIDANEQQRLTIAQAFADDDVIAEFSREKEDKVEKAKPKDIDLTLPGWGSWGGDGIKVSTKKRKRFTIKAPPALPRKDSNLGHVILNEARMAAVAKHMVHEIPFPYTSSEQFERSIRAPLGKTWNPQAVHKDLVKPKVITKLGKIIQPINKSEVSKYLKKKAKKDADSKLLDSKKTDSKKTDSNKQVKRLDKHAKGNIKSQKHKNQNKHVKHGKGIKK